MDKMVFFTSRNVHFDFSLRTSSCFSEISSNATEKKLQSNTFRLRENDFTPKGSSSGPNTHIYTNGNALEV